MTTPTPFPHQEAGAEFLAARAAAGLFDDPGLGKTGSSLLAAKKAGCKRILIVCPVVVQRNWAREVEMWLGRTDVQIIRRSEAKLDDRRGVVVAPYSLVASPKLRATLTAQRWDALICDEAHYLKTPQAKRTLAVYGLDASGRPGLAQASDRVWLLTGTPMPNNPTELWSHLRALAPRRLDVDGKVLGYRAFRDRYCTLSPSSYTPDGWRVTGAKNMDELRRRLVGFSIRRRKTDHLNLPPLRWGTVALDVIKLPPELEKLEADLPDDPKAAVEALRDSEHFSTWRRLCGIAKAEAAVELLADELSEGTEKVVVFAHHREVAETLLAGLAKFGAVSILGSTPLDQRQANVDAFQRNPAVRVAICNIVAGGVGVTLTASSNVVFVESSWVPGEMQQAADRCHRIGQKAESVLARVLTLSGSIDELVEATLATKRSMIRQLEN